MYLCLEEYHRPETVADCLDMLGDPATAVIAGGTLLNATGHEDLRRLIDLQALPFGGIEVTDGLAHMGALSTLTELAEADLPASLAALGGATRAERNRALRNRSTLGGRLSADRADGRLATALLALGAEVEVHAAGGTETLPLIDWLDRGDEKRGQVLGKASVPTGGDFSAYLAFSHAAMAPPACDAALSASPSGIRIASGGHAAGATGTRLLPMTGAFVEGLARRTETASFEAELRKTASGELPEYGDLLAAGDWRRHVAVTLIVRLVEAWLAQGGGA